MRWCEVCERELYPGERLKGFLRPFGLLYGTREKRRVRWLCRRCLRKVINQPETPPPSITPEHMAVALQREDLQWYGGSTEDGGEQWNPSQRHALLFPDEDAAHREAQKLRAKGHKLHSVMVHRRS
jgi:hypothetical protein